MRLGSPPSVYLDANAVIRLVEGGDEGDGLRLFLFDRAADNLLHLVTSEFTLAEVLVRPMRDSDHILVEADEDFLKSDERLDVVSLDRATLTQSAEIRAKIGNKAADAIHIATAVRCGCSIFLSDDLRIRLPTGIARLGLDDAVDPDRWP